MIQQDTAAAPQPTQPAAPQQPAAPAATAPAAPAAPVEAPATLHDFALGLLKDPAALSAFQLNPEGVLSSCGLSDITAADVHEILPLVLDTVSQFDVLGATSTVTALVNDVPVVGNVPVLGDFSGLGDVSHTLDASVLTGTEVASNVTGLVHDNSVVTKVTDVAGVDVHGTTDALVQNLDTGSLVQNIDTGSLVHNVVGSNSLVQDVLVKDVANVDTTVHHVTDVTQNVVQNVAHVGDVQSTVGQVVGDLKVGDVGVLDHGVGGLLDLHH